jgi:hypothetical protein
MSQAAYSVAMTERLATTAAAHLLSRDGQEDLCFALWRPSQGRSRTTALVHRLLLPKRRERRVHGNASFAPAYLERAMSVAAAEGAGLALLHSHPGGRGWQGMSLDDVRAEQGNAGAVLGATGKPFVGLTLAGDRNWSGRFWMRTAPRTYARQNCTTVRVVGNRLKVTYMDELAPAPVATAEQTRTISAWGADVQQHIARLRVGLIGSGSVGGLVGDAVARTGFEDMLLMDFDSIEIHNLDRLSYATRNDVGNLKVDVQAEHLAARATADPFRVQKVPSAVFEDDGFRAALDCDVLFACVDRPWGRYVLNLIAYAHLVPVIDGGIAVRCNKHGELAAADWKAHTATIGRTCLQCLGQYDPGFVQAEREGLLDDPAYISGLSNDHPLKMRENVFAFSMSCASMQLLQMLALTIDPLGQPNPGAQLYHFVGNITEEPVFGGCHTECQFPSLAALGDDCGIEATGVRKEFRGIPSGDGSNLSQPMKHEEQ